MLNRFLYKSTDNNSNLFKIDNFLFLFYIAYLLISISGYFIIDFVKIRPVTYVVYSIYTFFIVAGAYIGFKAPKYSYNRIRFLGIDTFMWLSLFLCTLLVIYEWKLIINYFGSIRYIINGAFIVRITQIGQAKGIIPVSISYPLSIIFALFSLSLSLYGYSGKKKHLFFALFSFVVIFLMDLTVFGRVGIVYAVFSYLGYLLVFKKKIITYKKILTAFGLLGIISLPRLIRGSFDNFSATLRDVIPLFKYKIPDFLNFLIIIFIYYFTSLFALSEYLAKSQDSLTFGKRLFTPVYNIVVRVIGVERQTMIDLQANIPFRSNIYSIIKEIISDFSYPGLLIIPIFFGLCLGMIFRKNGLFFRALQIYMIGWVFYTPIYNVFSFGGYLISFVFLLLMAVLFNPKEIPYRQ